MYKPTQVDVGAIALNPVGNTLLDFADRQAKLYANQSDRAIQAQKIAMDQNRFAREQELNKRQDLEYNREIGLRDMRKNLAAEYEANPYADVWGGGAANKMLDKQVLDYVNSGKEITPEMATKLQGLYETNRPFKEDLSQVFRSKLLAAGEDPAKADAYAKSMTDSMPFSRATLQAQLDKQQEIQQKVYDANAYAKLEALKLNKDADKLNANNATEILKSRISNGFGGIGGGTGGGGSKGTAPGGYSNLTADELSLSWMPAFTRMGDEKETQDIINGLQAKSVPSGVAQKALDESVVTKNGDRYVDKNLLKTNVDRYMGMYSQTGAGGTGATTVNADVNPKDLLAQFAPRQIAGYNPEGMLERAKVVVPELFVGEAVSPSVSTFDSPESKKALSNTLNNNGFNVDSYTKSIVPVEGGSGDNKGKYQGIGQFSEDTLKGLKTYNDWKKYQSDPEYQLNATKEYANQNAKFLESNKLPVNDFTVYMAHNLGPESARNMLSGLVNGEPMTKQTKLFALNQGIPNTFPKIPVGKAGAGQIDMSRVTDEELAKYSDKEVAQAYISRFSDKFSTTPSVKESIDIADDTAPSSTPAIKNLLDKSNVGVESSADIRSKMDLLNKSGINSVSDEQAFRELEARFKATKAKEDKTPVQKHSKNLLELLGVGPRESKQPNLTGSKTNIMENPDASKEEPGLEDRSLDFVGARPLLKIKIPKKIISIDDALSLEGGLKVDGKLAEDLFGKAPLAKVRDISIGTKPMTTATREEIKANLVTLRNIQNPSQEVIDLIERMNTILRTNK